MLGVDHDGNASLTFRKYGRTMGLAYRDSTLFVAADGYIFELENDGEHGEKFDASFVPRRANNIGDVDFHELGFTDDGLCFVSTRYSCIAKLDKKKSFKPVFKPEFVGAYVPEDRCHLNGMAIENGTLKAVSVCSRSDSLDGWRGNRQNGGAIIDVTNSGVITGNLSMPHSPRYRNGKLWFLDSGRGFIVGPEDRIYFCPGFLRGLLFLDNHALVTVSLPREGVFKGLELDDNIRARVGIAMCGVLVVNLETGAIDHWLKIDGETRELFDLVAVPNIKCPLLFSPSDANLPNRITIQRGDA